MRDPVQPSYALPVPDARRVLASTVFADESPLLKRARDLSLAAISTSTLRAYEYALRDWGRWCREAQCCAVPATLQTVILYLADCSQRIGPASLRQRVWAINRLHQYYDFEPVARGIRIRDLMRGAFKMSPPPKGQNPLRLRDVAKIVRWLDTHQPPNRALRDRALFLIGFYGALRASEIAKLKTQDIRVDEDGMRVIIRSSKTDPYRRGQAIWIGRSLNTAFCPVAAYESWLELIAAGPVFPQIYRGDQISRIGIGSARVSEIVKAYCVRLGYGQGYSAHSLRAGFVTSGYEADVDESKLAAVTRHTSIENLRSYRRKADPWKHNITRELGL